MSTGKTEQYRLGFLTALEIDDKGFVGGLLVTNQYGRPLEFQCTLPVKPNSVQERLYGPTLLPFLLGELIAATLLDKATVKPHLVLTDREEILELRHHASTPVAIVQITERGPSVTASPGAALTSADLPAVLPTSAARNTNDGLAAGEARLGRQRLRFHSAHAEDANLVRQHVSEVPKDADLAEPFSRVRDALQETLRAGALR
jgi:hypothetical protein